MELKGKTAACDFMNEICEVKMGDLSVADDQCECLLGAITVCIFIDYRYLFSYFFSFL